MAEQPPHTRITLKDALSFPYRLCHPPPAVGRVRSWGVTPFVDVKLDDVLARKHLPPLGLKDFEEYLIFVEQAPENLYFILWLQEYTARHTAWAQRAQGGQAARPPGGSLPPDSSLALFYARAKQTFFTLNAAFELDVPSDILAPFHAPSFRSNSPGKRVRSYSLQWQAQVVHPDPSVFRDLEAEVRTKLEHSLSQFIRAASTNVGSMRAACGITAGITVFLLAGLVPLIIETGGWAVGPHNRLMRLTALPGIWLGLTILVASLHGVCIMIYVFGDIRQLRKFELERPPISSPIPVGPVANPTLPKPAMTIEPVRGPPIMQPPQPPSRNRGQGFRETTPSPEPRVAQSSPSTASLSSIRSSEDASDETSSMESFDISPAYFDPFPAAEGPATSAAFYRTTAMPMHSTPPPSSLPAPISVDPDTCAFPAVTYIPPDVRARHPHLASYVHSPPQSAAANASATPMAGARFIPPDDLEPVSPSTSSTTAIEHGNDLDELERGRRTNKPHPNPARPIFDFDLLPIPVKHADTPAAPVSINKPLPSVPPRKSSTASSEQPRTPSSVLGRIQYKCNNRSYPADDKESPESEKRTIPAHQAQLRDRDGGGLVASVRALVIPRFTANVPFLTPVTRIRSPIVVRTQWEVTVRSAALALVLSAVLMGIVIGAVP